MPHLAANGAEQGCRTAVQVWFARGPGDRHLPISAMLALLLKDIPLRTLHAKTVAKANWRTFKNILITSQPNSRTWRHEIQEHSPHEIQEQLRTSTRNSITSSFTFTSRRFDTAPHMLLKYLPKCAILGEVVRAMLPSNGRQVRICGS